MNDAPAESKKDGTQKPDPKNKAKKGKKPEEEKSESSEESDQTDTEREREAGQKGSLKKFDAKQEKKLIKSKYDRILAEMTEEEQLEYLEFQKKKI